MDTTTKMAIVIVLLLMAVVYLYSTQKAEYTDLLAAQQALTNEQANLTKTQSDLAATTAQLADLRQQVATEFSRNTDVSTQITTCQVQLANCTSQLATLQQQADLWTAIRAYMSVFNSSLTSLNSMQSSLDQARASNSSNVGVLQSTLSNYRSQQAAILQPLWNAIIAKALVLNLSESDLVNQGYLPVSHK